VRLWLSTLTTSNNVQYVLMSLLFALKGPVVPLVLAPLAICAFYQWATVVSKLCAESALWLRSGAKMFDRLQHAMQHAMILCTTIEMAIGFQLILQLASSARNPSTALLFWNLLRMRYKCEPTPTRPHEPPVKINTPREDGLAHHAHTSRTNLADAWASAIRAAFQTLSALKPR
jgi:hypothetical protein